MHLDNKNLSLFLADDDLDYRTLFLEALDRLGIRAQIRTFDNGVDLMADLLDLNTDLPDILYLDLNMPLMTGEECLYDIRNEQTLAEIPIVIYSGYYDDRNIEMLREKGADRFLQKPTSFTALQELIERSILSIIKPTENEPFLIK